MNDDRATGNNIENGDDRPPVQPSDGSETVDGSAPPPPTRVNGDLPRNASVTTFLRDRENLRGDVSVDRDAGELISGQAEDRYRLLDEIARGGMGAILKIVDNDIRRPVAMKVMLGEEKGERLERFVEEAQVTGQLEHPNIVPVHELGINASGRIFFTMKLVRGESLQDILEKVADPTEDARERFPLGLRLEILLKVCEAVAFAHSKGVIHRDLKPENIMVGAFGEVLVMDWGLARIRGREDTVRDEVVASVRSDRELGRTLQGQIMGTPSYMPPEQASGDVDAIDERSDVFALGGLLYAILTQEPPHVGDTLEDVLRNAVAGKVTPPEKRVPFARVPAELGSICMKAMAPSKSDRYASVEQLADDLRAYVGHRLVSAHRYGPGARFLRFVQRHPAGTLSSAVALLLIVLGGSATWVMGERASAAQAKVREQAAMLREETARSEAEALRAEQAERRKDQAEVEAERARDSLEKGRRVSALLRKAHLELAPVLQKLKDIHFDQIDRAEKRRRADALWPTVEAFERDHVPDDSASRAAWLGVKGWLTYFASRETEALNRFRESRRLDPDVGYGYLFQGMVLFSRYIGKQALPAVQVSHGGVEFGNVRPETAEMKALRASLDHVLSGMANVRVWGESAREDMQTVLEGFRGLHRGDFEAADRGLTAAMAISELVWMRDELLVARCKVRYLLKRFEAALSDVKKVLDRRPGNVEALNYLGDVQVALALTAPRRKQDPARFFGRAVTAYDGCLERDPGFLAGYLKRGMARQYLAETMAQRGMDPLPAYKLAIDDFTAAIEKGWTLPDAYNNRGGVYLKMGIHFAENGDRPDDLFELARRDLTEALRQKPDMATTANSLGVLFNRIGMLVASRRLDPKPYFEKAAAYLNRAIAKNPDYISAYNNAGTVYMNLGSVAANAGSDPEPHYVKALGLFEEILKRAPHYWMAHANRGSLYMRLGDAERAVESFEAALEIAGDAAPALKDALARAQAARDRNR